MNATRSVILINDPGVDGAFTTSLALLDPRIEIAAVLATPGNVSAQQATRNLRTILDLVDPPRLPRLGIAPPASFDVDGRQLHGANGLAGLQFPAIEPMHSQTSERLLVELARANPETHTVLLMGPATVLASALDREPALPKLLRQVIMVGGSWKSPGNCGPGIDFHFRCDPESAKKSPECRFQSHPHPPRRQCGSGGFPRRHGTLFMRHTHWRVPQATDPVRHPVRGQPTRCGGLPHEGHGRPAHAVTRG